MSATHTRSAPSVAHLRGEALEAARRVVARAIMDQAGVTADSRCDNVHTADERDRAQWVEDLDQLDRLVRVQSAIGYPGQPSEDSHRLLSGEHAMHLGHTASDELRWASDAIDECNRRGGREEERGWHAGRVDNARKTLAALGEPAAS